jgi:hypothetical protein
MRDRVRAHEQPAESQRYLRGSKLWLARVATLIGVAISVGLFVLGLQARFAELRTAPSVSHAARPFINPPISLSSPLAPLQLTAEDAAVLEDMGLTLEAYAAFIVACEAAIMIIGLVVTVVLLWRCGGDWMAMFSALGFALFGVAFTPTVYALARQSTSWLIPLSMLAAAISGVLVLFISLFPDGRFVPRWTRFLIIPTLVWVAIIPLNIAPALNPFAVPLPLLAITVLASAVLLCGALIYRYRRVSTPTQRQQTKWFVVGVVLGFAGILIYYLNVLALIFPGLWTPGRATVVYHLILAILI